MFCDIIHGLLQKPENDRFQIIRDITFFYLDLFIDANFGIRIFHFTAKPGNGRKDSQIIQNGGAKVTGYGSHFFHSFLDRRDNGFQGLSNLFGVLLSYFIKRRLHGEFNGTQALSDSVMKLTRYPFSFFLLGVKQLGGETPKLRL